MVLCKGNAWMTTTWWRMDYACFRGTRFRPPLVVGEDSRHQKHRSPELPPHSSRTSCSSNTSFLRHWTCSVHLISSFFIAQVIELLDRHLHTSNPTPIERSNLGSIKLEESTRCPTILLAKTEVVRSIDTARYQNPHPPLHRSPPTLPPLFRRV